MSRSNNFTKRMICFVMSVLLAISISLPVYATNKASHGEVIVGGCLFGLKMQTNGIPVVGVDTVTTANGTRSPAYDAGIKLKDTIISINGITVSSVSQVTDMISDSDGKALRFNILRNGTEKELSISPVKGTDGQFHIGIWIRDSAAGIGTVTYIDPQTLEFAGLGHGICDGDTGALLPLSRGIVTEAQISKVVKGVCGVPGEIKGAFKGGKIGALLKTP